MQEPRTRAVEGDGPATPEPVAARLLRRLSTRGRVGTELAFRLDQARALGVRAAARSLTGGADSLVAAFDRIRGEQYQAFWAATATAVGAEVADLGGDFLEISRGAATTVVRRTLVMMDSPATLDLAGDKMLVHRLLAAEGLPVAAHRRVEPGDWEEAVRFLLDTGGPCVVKPACNTGAGDGVTCGLESPAEVRRACLHAARWRGSVLVEQSVVGEEYRILFLDGEPIDVVRRERPQLTGDGRRDVRALVAAENERRVFAGQAETARPLRSDLDMEITLRHAGISLTDAPGYGVEFAVKSSVSDNAARENTTVGGLSPELLAEAAAAVRATHLRLAGVDVVTPDPDRGLVDAGGVILEVNSTPGLHHHFVVADPLHATPIGPMILERLLRG